MMRHCCRGRRQTWLLISATYRRAVARRLITVAVTAFTSEQSDEPTNIIARLYGAVSVHPICNEYTNYVSAAWIGR